MNAPVNRMNRCIALSQVPGDEARRELLATLDVPEWPVRLAALVALGDRRDPATLNALLRVLELETAAPLYTQPGELEHVGAAQATAAPPVFPARHDRCDESCVGTTEPAQTGRVSGARRVGDCGCPRHRGARRMRNDGGR